MSVRAKNGADVYGNSTTVTTAQSGGGNNTEGGGDGGTIVDESVAPSISTVAISGTLAVGEALSGSYAFAANTGNPTDASEYQWGLKGKTASVVNSGSGKAISQSGVVPSYTLQSSDAGQVLEMSVRAKNGSSIYGNTATVTTAQSGGGNNTEGGGDGGTIVDETAAPSISNVLIQGKLTVGEKLSGSYKFNPLTGNIVDKSLALWGKKGTTAVSVNTKGTLTQSGALPPYTLQSSDAGQVFEVTVLAKNGSGIIGNKETVDTAQSGNGNNTEGGDNGTIGYIPISGTISVNGKDFTVDSGFPTLAFKNAKFTIKLDNGESANNYDWSSNSGSVAVSNGTITFNSIPSKNEEITIKAVQKSNLGKAFVYSFSINKWFINNGSNTLQLTAAKNYCVNQSAILPAEKELSLGYNKRGIGSLWSEWGNMGNYPGSGFISPDGYWNSDGSVVRLDVGNSLSSSSTDPSYVSCIKDI